MINEYPLPKRLELPALLATALLEAAANMAKASQDAFRTARRIRRGATLRPGRETPLWNQLRGQLRLHLTKRGEQAVLARQLGLPRQRVQAFVTAGDQMPDAERTLQLLAWLALVQQGRRPS
jgi:hypothetical protein